MKLTSCGERPPPASYYSLHTGDGSRTEVTSRPHACARRELCGRRQGASSVPYFQKCLRPLLKERLRAQASENRYIQCTRWPSDESRSVDGNLSRARYGSDLSHVPFIARVCWNVSCVPPARVCNTTGKVGAINVERPCNTIGIAPTQNIAGSSVSLESPYKKTPFTRVLSGLLACITTLLRCGHVPMPMKCTLQCPPLNAQDCTPAWPRNQCRPSMCHPDIGGCLESSANLRQCRLHVLIRRPVVLQVLQFYLPSDNCR